MKNQTHLDLPRRTMIASALGLGAAGALTSGAAGAAAIPTNPTQVFWVKLGSIQGDSTSARHPATMDTLTWSLGTDSTVNPLGTSSGSAASKSKPRDFVFVKYMDRSSPLLHQACAKGTHFKALDLWGATGGETTFDYLHVKLENVQVSSYATAPSEYDARPIDVVHARFAKITQTFTFQSPASGALDSVVFTFDFATNT